MANLHPFDNKNITVLVEIRTVWRHKLSGREMIARLVPQTLRAGALAEVGDKLVVFVEQGDA